MQSPKPKLIAVIGAESSGNRLIFETLKHSCNYTDDENKMELWWSGKEIECDVDRITMRSLPHGGIGDNRRFVDPIGFGRRALESGYDMRFVVTTRDKNIARISKTAIHCQNNSEMAVQEMEKAKSILSSLLGAHDDRCFLWNYETFMYLQEYYLFRLYKWLGIANGEYPKLVDGNLKYLKA